MCWLFLPVQGGLVELLPTETSHTAHASLSPGARARALSAMAALPADTDSFFALARLGEFFAGKSLRGVPGADMATVLNGFAMGMSEAAAKDLQRLMPLLQVLSQVESDISDTWGEKAMPAAARAIVAQQREMQQRMGEMLVQATQDYHLAPIYLVLSCNPGGESLLHQLSVLPLMVPMESDGPLVLTARGSSRGFYLRGDALDLRAANLSPEHEAAIARNLQQARLYVMAEVLGDKLVLVICSNLDEVKLPRRATQSLLGTDKMDAFDAFMQRDVLALGSCSPSVVNMGEELHFCACQGAAAFLGSVFKRLGEDNAAMAAAAAAVEQLKQQLHAWMPPRREPEQFVMWREADSLYLQLVSDACGQSFAPGVLADETCSASPETVLYVESTALHGLPAVDVPTVLGQVECVQQAYISTLLPEYAAHEAVSLRTMQKYRPAWEKMAEGWKKISGALGNNLTLLVQKKNKAELPVAFSVRAEVTEPSALKEGGAMLQEALRELDIPGMGKSLQIQQQEQAVLLSTEADKGLPAVRGGTEVPGGAVFSLHVQALADVMKQTSFSEAETLENLASVVKKLEGGMTVRGTKLCVLFRLTLQ